MLNSNLLGSFSAWAVVTFSALLLLLLAHVFFSSATDKLEDKYFNG